VGISSKPSVTASAKRPDPPVHYHYSILSEKLFQERNCFFFELFDIIIFLDRSRVDQNNEELAANFCWAWLSLSPDSSLGKTVCYRRKTIPA